MREHELQRYFKKGRAVVSPETYAIVKTERACAGSFAVIKDPRETTCVIEETKLRSQKFLGMEGGWRMITFDMILPFGLVGFMARISGALAKEGISIFAVSAYSTDHVFVKARDLDRAVATLEKLGMIVQRP
jgi:uncharacterized protein